MKKLISLIFLLVNNFLFAQTSQFVFDHLNSENGLSNNGVSCIFQDSKGLIWIGTYNGLNKYNGYEIKTYYNEGSATNTLSDNRITCILEDRNKNLWIGTHDGGLNLYNKETDNFTSFLSSDRGPKSISSNTIECLYEDKSGRLWIGTNHGLNVFDKDRKKITKYFNTPKQSSINSNQIYSIIEYKKDLLILTNKKVLNKYHYQKNTFLPYKLPPSTINYLNTARLLFQDKKENLWIGTLDDGLFQIKENRVVQFNKYSALSHNLIKTLLEDGEGNLWVGTDGGGINIIDSSGKIKDRIFNKPEHTSDLNSDAIYSLFRDKAGTIWVGTFTGGVNIYNKQKGNFAHYKNILNDKTSLSNNSVLSIIEDKQGQIWLGTDGGGLNLLNKEKGIFSHFKSISSDPNSLSSNIVKSLCVDKSGNLWIGTYLGGLNLFDRKSNRFTRFLHDPADPTSIGGNIVWSIFEDSRKNLWVSTLGSGVSVLNSSNMSFKRYIPFIGDGSLGDYNIFTILEDHEGKIWLGTENNGLNLYDHKTDKFSYFRNDPKNRNSISSNHVFVLFEDSKKNLWIGTAGGGLNLMDKKNNTFTAFTTDQGLPSDVVCGITEDNKGFLWVSTGQGLCKFDPVKRTFITYSKHDGLQANEFNINSVCKSKTGKLYFGGQNGFNVFNPGQIETNKYVPPVILTDLKIFNKSVNIGSQDSILHKQISETNELKLTYKESVISFQFAALDYNAPSKNQYAYKLEGFDKGWTYTGNKREATYTNLDAGTYTFKVKGSNNDGVWNDKPTEIQIRITPPWWKTVWFRVLAGITIILITATTYKVREEYIRRAMKLERMRELKVKEAEIRAEKLKYEKAMIEMSKNKLESEVTLKNSKLASSVISIVKQNETLLSIKENIEETLKEKDEALQKKNLKKVIKTIDQEVKPEQNWNEFEHLFNQIHENFIQRLKEHYPDLTNRDLKLCAYLRMNLNSKEIAPLIGVSVRGVEDMRYRIRKKMDLDTSVNLAEFILSF